MELQYKYPSNYQANKENCSSQQSIHDVLVIKFEI